MSHLILHGEDGEERETDSAGSAVFVYIKSNPTQEYDQYGRHKQAQHVVVYVPPEHKLHLYTAERTCSR